MRSALLLLLAALSISPQEQQQTARIEGLVVRAAGDTPIGQVRILLLAENSDDKGGYATFTDAEGRFALRNIQAGRYRLIASQPGFMYSEFGQKRPGTEGTPIDIVAGKSLVNLTIRMTAGSVVSGRVYDDTGKPLPNTRVQLVHRRYTPSGRAIVNMLAGTETNDLGEYRLFWVPPGTYYVAATTQIAEVFRESSLTLNEQYEGNRGMFLPTFYPNSLRAEQATELRVEPGMELRGIDFLMTRVPTVKVSGQLIDGVSGQTLVKTSVALHPRSEDWAKLAILPGAITDAKGDFTFPLVPAGVYALGAVTGGVNGGRLSGQIDVQVGDKNISGLRAIVQRAPVLKGRVIAEPGAPDVRIDSLSFESVGEGDDGAAGIGEDGTFVASNLGSGVFRAVLNAREGFFIRSARSGSRNVLREGVDTRPASIDPLEITVGFSTAEIQGSVIDAQDKPAAGTQVVLIPNTDRAMRVDLFRKTSADPLGRFAIHGVAPGDYKLFAWDDIEPYVYFDPAFLELYESRGTPIHVEQNGRARVTLKSFP